MSFTPRGSSQSVPDIFGLTGMPSRVAEEPPTDPQLEIPSVELESPSTGLRQPTAPRYTSSEGDLLDRDRLSALPVSATLPRQRGSASSSPQRSASHPPLPDELGRRSTESEPAMSRAGRSSESARGVRGALEAFSRPFRSSAEGNRTSSPTRGSPRLWPLAFIPLSQTRSRPEPFEPKDPYRSDFRELVKRRFRFRRWSRHFLRQLIRHALLRLPSTYFTRVKRVFESAELSKNEISKMIEGRKEGNMPRTWTRENATASALMFQEAWQEFIDSVMKEWKTMNIVSALLTTGILTLFQIEDASNDPTTRTAALLSLVCALMSLLYGGIYILRFTTMRGMDKALRWAEEMESTTGSTFWNVWVLLATPVVWLAWSMFFFFVAIMAFIWTTGTTVPPRPLTPRQAVAPRVVVTIIFALGILVFVAVLRTFNSWSTARPRQRRRVIDIYGSPDSFKTRELKTMEPKGLGAEPPEIQV